VDRLRSDRALAESGVQLLEFSTDGARIRVVDGVADTRALTYLREHYPDAYASRMAAACYHRTHVWTVGILPIPLPSSRWTPSASSGHERPEPGRKW
jgi:hypothetical protein